MPELGGLSTSSARRDGVAAVSACRPPVEGAGFRVASGGGLIHTLAAYLEWDAVPVALGVGLEGLAQGGRSLLEDLLGALQRTGRRKAPSPTGKSS